MNGNLVCKLVGYYNFQSKDKTKLLYMVQCLYTESDNAKFNVRSNILNIFVDEEQYKNIINKYQIGQDITVEFTANAGSNKLYYKVVG